MPTRHPTTWMQLSVHTSLVWSFTMRCDKSSDYDCFLKEKKNNGKKFETIDDKGNNQTMLRVMEVNRRKKSLLSVHAVSVGRQSNDSIWVSMAPS